MNAQDLKNLIESGEDKAELILRSEKLKDYEKLLILYTMNIEELSNFIRNHREFLDENEITPYQIVVNMESDEQRKLLTKLEEMNLTLNEKREILAILDLEVKQSIDTSTMPEEYKTAISMQTIKYEDKIVFDLNRNLEDYCGLDRLLRVNPEQYTMEQRDKFKQLCKICPDLEVINLLNDSKPKLSTANEYIQAEEWIESLINSLKPEYTQAQKLAIIDNAIGKKISYSPDFETEVFDTGDCRALWKIISSGYGVCNGIANVEHYILNRIGIESEMISSGTHSFLKIKEIELPFANGETIKGDTILDPTWNLMYHRFEARPHNFCINYEEARKNDINSNNIDGEAHKNDKELQDVTLGLDEKSLRQLFLSVNLVDKNGDFPIKDLMDKSEMLHELYSNEPEVEIRKQFLLLSKACPEFAKCQNSSMGILSMILLNHINFNKCVVKRVYDKSDKEKRPILYVYIDIEEIGKRFYYADKEQAKFIELTQEEFTEKFECYENDLKKANGIRPWESNEQIKENENLATSSGKIFAEEGEER